MPIYGFKDKNVAIKLKKLADSLEPDDRSGILYGKKTYPTIRCYWVEVQKGKIVSAAKDDKPTCVGYGDVWLLERDSENEDIEASLCLKYTLDDQGNKVEETVFNPLSREFSEGDRFFTVQDMNGDLWILDDTVITLAEATECFHPGSEGTFLKMRVVDGEWEVTEDEITVADPESKNFLLQGERVFVLFRGMRGTEKIYDIIGEHGLSRSAKALDNIECFGSGGAEILSFKSGGFFSCVGSDTRCYISACNVVGGTRCILKNEKIHVRFYEQNWHIITTPKNSLFFATLINDLCGDPEDIALQGLVPLEYCEKVPSMISAQNPFKLSGCSGAKVLVVRDNANCAGTYHIIQIVHTVVDYVKGIRYQHGSIGTNCELQLKHHKASIIECCPPDAWGCQDEIKQDGLCIKMYNHNVLSNLRIKQQGPTGGTSGTSGETDCEVIIEGQKDSFCVFDPFTEGPYTELGSISFTPKTVMVDLYDDGTCVQKVKQNVYVMCWDDELPADPVFCTTDCVSSGSGA